MNLPITTAASQALAVLHDAQAQVVSGEITAAVAMVELADTYRLDHDHVMVGTERMIRGGADGTPLVSEYLACEIGALLGLSPASASLKLAEVLNLRWRHPRLWQAVLDGSVRVWRAAAVASKVAQAGLDRDAADWVDRQMAVAAHIQPWSRALGTLEKLILQADPALAAERAEQAAATRRVQIGRIDQGHCDLWGRLDATDALALDQALESAAEAMGDDTGLTKQQRRAAALGDLARGSFGQQPLPVELVVHLASTDAPVAEAGRHGVLLREQLADLLHGCRVNVRPVLTIHAEDAPAAGVPGYQIPELLRRAVCERNPVDVFPYGTLTSERCDLDHTVAFDVTDLSGRLQTHQGNLGPLSRRAHRAKTHGGWSLTQPKPGTFEWESPAGYRYRVTPDGTTPIGVRPRSRDQLEALGAQLVAKARRANDVQVCRRLLLAVVASRGDPPKSRLPRDDRPESGRRNSGPPGAAPHAGTAADAIDPPF